MASSSNFEQTMADEIDLLTKREAEFFPVVSYRPFTLPISIMPCLYTPQSHLPLTPPEYIPSYPGGGGIQLNSHQFAVGGHGIAGPDKGAYDYNMDSYGRKALASFVNSQSYHASQQQPLQANYTGVPPPGITHPNSHYYPVSAGSVAMPISAQRRVELPPILVEDNYHQQRPELRKSERLPAPEEKPVGGVSAHLDYDMDEMTEFVGTMAMRLCGFYPFMRFCTLSTNNLRSVYPMAAQDRIPSEFRKFILQILSSTRLPSSTILLGLVYLRERMTTSGLTIAMRHDVVYRMITIALLLASKFLDDNTFQNKSWAEVTGLPVAELNALEKEWLELMDWHLHVDPEGTKGFSQYKTMWETWVRNNAPKTSAPALAPINTNVRRHCPTAPVFSPQAMYPTQQHHYSHSHSNVIGERTIQLPPPQSQQHHDNGYWWGENSPPSAPETGPATPEGYFGWASAFGPQASIPSQHQQPTYTRNLPPIMAYTPGHQHTWAGGPSCPCGFCQRPDNYFMTGMAQPVTA
ncbi:hypothetical protein RUND412_009313 [Rhizina undulata]